MNGNGREAPMADSREQRALKDPEAARYIGMSESWLRQSRSHGNPDAPPHVKIGRSVRYLRADLDVWLAGRRVRYIEPG